MPGYKSLMGTLLGDPDTIETEKYFVSTTCLVASIFSIILCVIHLIMNLKLAPVILAGSGSIVMLGLYYFVRFRSCLFIPKILLSILGLCMLDLTWYSKFLSNGPVLFFILIFGALILWVWDGKPLLILLGIYFLNLALLFIIDRNSPENLSTYPDIITRKNDIYLSFTLYSTLLIFLLYIVKKEYHRQKQNALRSDKLKTAFLTNMSHEIRTPMNSIIGFSQLLLDETDSDRKEKYSKIIHTSSNNLLLLLNDIIDLSKIEANDIKIEFSNFSVRELFTELKESFSLELTSCGKEQVTLDFSISSSDYSIYSDKLRLKQVLSNLLNNAIKFTSDGSIRFSCERLNNEYVFSVEDTGTGIPLEDQKIIFKRFTRFNYKGLNANSAGIGLSIVEKILDMLNSKIYVHSVIGEGSNFFFKLPCSSNPNALIST
ncbi:MAG: HAMP domain-containing sensor histidine kinase [Bacteroidales bacterium]|nr:HAMP domain-containing sensor histidine kinase [Bacteroidales bacterium]